MTTMTETITNKHGLEIQIESFCADGSNEWLLDIFNVAKIKVYEDLNALLPIDEENRRIEAYISYVKEKGGEL